MSFLYSSHYLINLNKLIETTTLPRPTQMLQIQQDNSHIIDDNNHTSHENINVRDMPDPHDIYSAALGASDTSQSFVHIPNVRDGDGNIILPQDYKLKLKDNAIVMVNVFLKLYVFQLISVTKKKLTTLQRWILRPNIRNNTSYARKEGDENGARIYQMILNSMQILPFSDPNQIGDPSSIGQKRKASDETPSKSESSKKRNAKPTRASKKFMPVRGSVGGPNHSKNLPKSTDIAMDTI